MTNEERIACCLQNAEEAERDLPPKQFGMSLPCHLIPGLWRELARRLAE